MADPPRSVVGLPVDAAVGAMHALINHWIAFHGVRRDMVEAIDGFLDASDGDRAGVEATGAFAIADIAVDPTDPVDRAG